MVTFAFGIVACSAGVLCNLIMNDWCSILFFPNCRNRSSVYFMEHFFEVPHLLLPRVTLIIALKFSLFSIPLAANVLSLGLITNGNLHARVCMSGEQTHILANYYLHFYRATFSQDNFFHFLVQSWWLRVRDYLLKRSHDSLCAQGVTQDYTKVVL